MIVATDTAQTKWWSLEDLSLGHGKLTNGIAFPAATPLSKAGTVHRVAFVMLFSEGLVHVIGQTIHNALVCSEDKYIKTWKSVTDLVVFVQLLFRNSLIAMQLQRKPCNAQVRGLTFNLLPDEWLCHTWPLTSSLREWQHYSLIRTPHTEEEKGCWRQLSWLCYCLCFAAHVPLSWE